MSIDKKQLELNVNIYALKPDFLNHELHYVFVSEDKTFRFGVWNDEPSNGEKKYYCFLTEDELALPEQGITLKESYVLKEEAIYPVAANADDFIFLIEQIKKGSTAKAIRGFSNDAIDEIADALKQKDLTVDKHVVTSKEGQHVLLIINNEIEASISATMIYFRLRPPFNVIMP